MAAKAGRLQIQLELEVAQLRRDLAATNAELKKASGQWQQQLKGLGAGLASAFKGAAITAAVAAFGMAVNKVVEDMGKIADESAKLGDTAEAYQRLAFAASQVGVEMETVVGASNKLQLQLGKIAKGDADKAADALHDLGISANELKGLSTTDAFIKVGGALGTVADKSQQAAIGAALFGKSWSTLLPLIGQGEDELRKAAENAIVVSDEAVAAGDAFGDAMDRMQASTMKFIAEALVPILPPFTALINALTKTQKETDDTGDEFSLLAEAMKLAAKVVLGVVTVFKAASIAVVALGQSIGATVGFVIEELMALNKAGNLAQDIRNIFNGKAWDALKAGSANAADAFRDSMGVIFDEAQKKGHDLEVLVNNAAKAIDEARATVANVKPPQTGGGEAGEDEDTKKKKDKKKATDELTKAEKDWLAIQAESDRKANEVSDAINEVTAAKMRLAGATEEQIRLWKLDQELADSTTRALSDLAAQSKALGEQFDAQQKADEDRREAAKQNAQSWRQFWEASISDVFMAMTEGADAAEEALKRLVIQLLATLAAQKAVAFYNSIFGAPAANGAAFGFGGAKFFAQGGIVNSPTAFAFAGGRMGVMGEAGPEAIMPLKRGSDGKLGVAGGGSVQIFNYAGAAVSVERDRENLRVLIEQVRGVVASDISRGGNQISGALERSYQVRR